MKKISYVISFIVPLVVFFIIHYFIMFNLSPAYFDGALAWGIFLIIEMGIFYGILKINNKKKTHTVVVSILVILIIILGKIAGSDVFNSSRAYQQIGEVKEESFVETIVPIDNTQIPIVDEDLAYKQAEKKLGEERGLGSQVEIGDFTLQQVKGQLVFVAPLEHSGFIKWWNNKTTPGYVQVSATDPSNVKLVQELDGKEIKLKYLESSCFSEDLYRHIRTSGFRTKGITDLTFELNEEGRPYYTVTTYKNTVFWNYKEADGVIVCDAQTGECNWYSLEDVPSWIDKIQPEDFISEQIDNYGKYEKGFWNSVLEQSGVIEKTPGLLTVYNNGECYYYTGMTSKGNDDATTGFMLVNTRTKEPKFFKMAGATESAAQSSAEGKIQEKGWTATLPVPINVQGIPTYFMSLKDKSGLIKSYAMVNIENYSIVSVGETIEKAQKNYIGSILQNGNDVVVGSDESFLYNLKGTVTRISSAIQDGDTYYYLIINGDNTKLYLASTGISNELPITREGDQVQISYLDDSNGTVDIAEFDNLEFIQQKSENQEKKDEQSNKETLDNSQNKITEVDPEETEKEWNNLSNEEKAKVLKNLK